MLFKRKEKPIEIPVPEKFPKFCTVCGSRTVVRYSKIGAYFVQCGADHWHYEEYWKDAKFYDPQTGKRLDV